MFTRVLLLFSLLLSSGTFVAQNCCDRSESLPGQSDCIIIPYIRPMNRLRAVLCNPRHFVCADGKEFEIRMRFEKFSCDAETIKYYTEAECSDGKLYKVKIKHNISEQKTRVQFINYFSGRENDFFFVEQSQADEIFTHFEKRRKLWQGIQSAISCSESTANMLLDKLLLTGPIELTDEDIFRPEDICY